MIQKQKIRLKKSSYIKTIDFERPSFTLDGRGFSCLVSNDYNLTNGDVISLEINDGGAISVKASVEEVLEQGWVELNTTFNLLDFKILSPSYNDGSDEEKNTEWRYFINNMGLIESGYETEDGKMVFPGLGVETVKYDKNSYPNTVTLPIRYYVENGLINYGGTYFAVDYDKDGDVASFQKIGNVTVFVNDRNKADWQYKTRINVFLPQDILIELDDVRVGKMEWYVSVDGSEFILEERPISLSGHTYFEKYLPNYDALIPNPNGDDYVEDLPENYGGEGEISKFPSITLWDGIEKNINSRVIPSEAGNILILNVNTDRFLNLYESNVITIERIADANTPYFMDDNETTVTINDLVYEVKTIDMVDFDGLREVFPDEVENRYFVKINSSRKVYFTKKEGDTEYSLLFDNNIKYPIHKRNKLEYNGREYFKEIDVNGSEDDEPVQYPFIIMSREKYSFEVYDTEEPNIYYCRLVDDKDDTSSGFREGKKQWIYNDIATNSGKYVFKLEPQRFFNDLGDVINLKRIFEERYDNEPIINLMPAISMRQLITEMSIPIHLTTLHGTNLFQEIDVTSEFFKDKRAEAINRVVDMEKDMYYPMIVKDTDLTDAVSIEFFLHLRTRNDDWTVRDDKMVEVEDIYGKDFVNGINVNVESSDFDDNYTKTSWNIKDYYEDFRFDGEQKYYQPSDLLGFFDFSDDDIFYQKSKVQKTFLRLSFFDTKDPQTQSLLGTSSVFFDSRSFFGKFTDKMTNPSDVKYINPKTWKGSSSLISCNREAVSKDGRKETILDDDLRMSATLSITNKIATDRSAEGFYNYIFREYSDKLHERRIYLRIQLNHAGHGEVIDLFQPMIKENGRMRLATYNEIDKNGLNLTELYDMLFIPVNVKYDEKNKKYCWYLPEEIVKHEENKIKFNLYEIKVRK